MVNVGCGVQVEKSHLFMSISLPNVQGTLFRVWQVYTY